MPASRISIRLPVAGMPSSGPVCVPRIVTVDRPGPEITQARLRRDRLAGRGGRTVLLVEQNARSGLAAAHIGAVLESGVVRLVRPAGALLADPDVARLYLGGHAAAAK
jgi:branched-chain amino acid transport system ATP-binding protein